MVCNLGVAGLSIPDHLFTAPPVTSEFAKKILDKIGTTADDSKTVGVISKDSFFYLYESPIILLLTERILQEIGIETVARALQKAQQHLKQLPFAILALASCLVSIQQILFIFTNFNDCRLTSNFGYLLIFTSTMVLGRSTHLPIID